MTLKRLFLSAIWLSVILPSAFAFQEDKPSPKRCCFPKPGDYALRLPDKGDYRAYFHVPAAVPVNPLTLSSYVQLKCRREGDEIKIELSLRVNPPEESEGAPCIFRCGTMPEGGYPGMVFTTYSARLGESVTLEELARFGIEPITVKVVSSNARTVNPSEINNLLSSIEVTSLEMARDRYLATLKNNSPRNVIGYYLQFENSGSIRQAGRKPLINSKETLDVIVGRPTRRPMYRTPKEGENDDEDAPSQSKVILAAVVFDDYTYEGDKRVALGVIAYFRTRSIQSRRVVSLLDAALKELKEKPEDYRKTLANLKRGASELSTTPENSVIDEMIKRYDPDELQKYWFTSEMKSTLSIIKHLLVEGITCLEGQEKLSDVLLGTWLREKRSIYDNPFPSQ